MTDKKKKNVRSIQKMYQGRNPEGRSLSYMIILRLVEEKGVKGAIQQIEAWGYVNTAVAT